MALTDLPWRITCLCPSARVDAAKAWYAQVVGGGEILMATYSASGVDPAEFHGVSGVLSNSQTQAFLVALCDGTAVNPPSNWAKWAQSTRKNWLSANLEQLQAATGYIVIFDDLLIGEWTWIQFILDAHGLKQITETI